VTEAVAERYEVVYEPEAEGGYHVFCPALTGCHSYGTTKAEARNKIEEAIVLWLETAAELGIPIPDRDTVTITLQ
jgi:predicted RNase H-like HicB family nuclease